MIETIIGIILAVLILTFFIYYAKGEIYYRLEQIEKHHSLFTYRQLKNLVLSGDITVYEEDVSIRFHEPNSTKYSWIGTYSFFDFLRLYIFQETQRIKAEKSNKPVEKNTEKEQLLQKMQDVLNQKNKKL